MIKKDSSRAFHAPTEFTACILSRGGMLRLWVTLLVGHATASAADRISEETVALNALYESTNGAGWDSNTNWWTGCKDRRDECGAWAAAGGECKAFPGCMHVECDRVSRG